MRIVPYNTGKSNKPVTLRDAMNQLFDESFWDPFDMFHSALMPRSTLLESKTYMPSIDVSETKKEITVKADVPGYDPKNIEVSVEDGVLSLQGTMSEEKEEKDEEKKWYKKECASGSFYRQFALPCSAKEDDVKCTFKNGKLTISIPKAKECTEKKKNLIDIEVK